MRRLRINFPKRWLASIGFSVIGPAVNLVFGQDSPDIKTIVESVAKVYEGQRQYDVSGATTIEEYSATGRGVLKSKFRIASQDPNKFRLEQESSGEIDGAPNGSPFGPMVIIGDGTDVWGISPMVNQYTKYRSSDLPTFRHG
jgi:outer membrane lipoprotein-sorting protein